MKTRTHTQIFSLLIPLFLLLFSINIYALTEEWSYDTNYAALYQIMTDGKGNVALFGVDDSGDYRIMWFDKKGNVVYQKASSHHSYGIIAFSKKGLAYVMNNGSQYVLYHVDKKGVESTESAAQREYFGITPISPAFPSKTDDKKGFFCGVLNTDTGLYIIKRYSHK